MRSITALTIAAQSSSRPTLPGTDSASPPALLISATTCSHASALRAQTATSASASAYACAIDLPMPRLAPVTSATLPLSEKRDPPVAMVQAPFN